jgi:flavin reductase (DIM6/NTAB) family NADH-FMN oxidoreductase RutF
MTATPLALFRRMRTGVYVVGVAHGGRANAFTATWITEVSFDPLLLALAINPGHASYPILKASGTFVVNVLHEGQAELARHFGTRSGRDTDKLRGIPTRPGDAGAPVLLEAAAYLECRVVETMPAGDHELVVARVVGGDLMAEDAVPLSSAETAEMDGSDELYPLGF